MGKCTACQIILKISSFVTDLHPIQSVLLYVQSTGVKIYEGWNFNSGKFLFTTGTK